MPSPQHQSAVFEIQKSIRPAHDDSGRGCFPYADIYFQFLDGSFKRPDVSIYCREIAKADSETAVTQIPEAAIEVLSQVSEAKYLEIGPPFLLSHGVKDNLVFNPFTSEIHHFRKDGVKVLPAPQDFVLECGSFIHI